MRYIEWAVMFLVAGIGIALANFVGFQVNFMDSVPRHPDPSCDLFCIRSDQ